MAEKFTFVHNTGSIGYRVLDPQDRAPCYGIVWHDIDGVCHWVAEFPGSHPGSGGGIPGFISREWAARFLHHYRKPELSGRP